MSQLLEVANALVVGLVVSIIRSYQLVISPLLGPTCRFAPSCSKYLIDATRRHGALRGAWMGMRRLVRCHPLNPGGPDPVR